MNNFSQLVIIGFISITYSCTSKSVDRMPKHTLAKINCEKNYVEIGRFLDSTFRRNDDLDIYIKFRLLNKDGDAHQLSDHAAVLFFTDSTVFSSQTELLIGKLYGSNNIVLFGVEKGMWSTIRVMARLNIAEDCIEKIKFLHNMETPGYGDHISENVWSRQFENAHISSGNSYGLTQNGGTVIDGKHNIDGISGSTRTSKSAVKLVNKILTEYKKRSQIR